MRTPCYHLNDIAKLCIQIHYNIFPHLPNKQNNCCSYGYLLVASLGVVASCSLVCLVGALLGDHVSYQFFCVLSTVLLCWVGISLLVEKYRLNCMLKSTSTASPPFQSLPLPALGKYFLCDLAVLG